MGYDGLDAVDVDVTNVDDESNPSGHYLTTGVLTNVNNQGWETVQLDHSYDSMVVVTTLNYGSSPVSVVPRIRNAFADSFEVQVSRTDSSSSPISSDVAVHYLVMEEGVYSEQIDGIKMEAVRFTSTVTDNEQSWAGEQRSYLNEYSSPVVVGQVMTSADSDWSVFWSRGDTRGEAPTSNSLYVGKHVGEDPDKSRSDETIGYVVLESGSGTVGTLSYHAFVGSDSVRGVGNSPPYNYSLNLNWDPDSAIASQAGMDGTDGSWGLLYGDQPLNGSAIHLAVDEDIADGSERRHTTEQIAVLLFSESAALVSGADVLTTGISGNEFLAHLRFQDGCFPISDEGTGVTEPLHKSQEVFWAETLPSGLFYDEMRASEYGFGGENGLLPEVENGYKENDYGDEEKVLECVMVEIANELDPVSALIKERFRDQP